MTVKVSIPAAPGSSAHDTHENGHGVTVKDGHLFVEPQYSDQPTVAVYAPGQWRSAVVS